MGRDILALPLLSGSSFLLSLQAAPQPGPGEGSMQQPKPRRDPRLRKRRWIRLWSPNGGESGAAWLRWGISPLRAQVKVVPARDGTGLCVSPALLSSNSAAGR